MNYRKLYEEHHDLKIPKDWDIHHIDADRENNKINNLIMLPSKLHQALHNHIGLLPKNQLKVLRRWYKKKGIYYTAYYLGKEIREVVSHMRVPKRLQKRNKIYIENKRKKYIDYAKKNNKKTDKLIDSLYENNGFEENYTCNWMPDDNKINYKLALNEIKLKDIRENIIENIEEKRKPRVKRNGVLIKDKNNESKPTTL